MYRETTRALIKLYKELCDRRYQKYWSKEHIENLELGMYFLVNVSCTNYGYENDGNTKHDEWERTSRRYVHIVIHKHHRIYAAVTNDVRVKPDALLKASEFKNIGNHDSCYRDSLSSLLSALYFEVYEECWSHVPAPHNKPPIAADIEVAFESCFTPILNFVEVEREPIKDSKESNHGYLDRLVSFKPLTVKLGV